MSSDVFLVLGLPRCEECSGDIRDDAVMHRVIDGYAHPWCVLSDPEDDAKAYGALDAAAVRNERWAS